MGYLCSTLTVPGIRDEQSKEQWRMLTEVILECIDLAAKSQPEFIELDHAASIALIAYTDSSEAWCSEAAQRKALRILKDHGPQASESKFIINDLLQDFIRSLFRDSKPDTVTAEGRKKTVPDVVEKKFSPSGLYDPVKRPWKYRDIHAATVLRWAVEKSDVS